MNLNSGNFSLILPSTKESTKDWSSVGTSACFHLSLSNIKLKNNPQNKKKLNRYT